jgi:STE24 endopeptidase
LSKLPKLAGIAIPILMAIVRRFPRTWPVWGTLVGIVFQIVVIVISPVFIAPLFNK